MSSVPPPPGEPPSGPRSAARHTAVPPAQAPPGRTHAPGAVVSLVFGILGLTLMPVIGSIIALVFGYTSRRAAEAQGGVYDDQLGQVGRVLGWVGLGIAAVFLLLAALVSLVLFGAWVLRGVEAGPVACLAGAGKC